jgi:hypothetical protein
MVRLARRSIVRRRAQVRLFESYARYISQWGCAFPNAVLFNFVES